MHPGEQGWRDPQIEEQSLLGAVFEAVCLYEEIPPEVLDEVLDTPPE